MSRLTFFRQSGWMALASGVFGCFMLVVHKVASRMGTEYDVFVTLMLALSQVSIPAVGLQLTFVQQTVTDLDAGRQADLKGALLTLLRSTFFLWLILVAALWLFREPILTNYKIPNPLALWATAGVALFSLWSPLLLGVLQGQQNFLWLGWATMLNGVVRLGAVVVFVLVLGGQATGAMWGVFLGMLVATAIAGWQIRDLWRGPAGPFAWLPWCKRVLPITLGMGALTYMLTQDGIAVQRFFNEQDRELYQGAGIIGRALYYFTAPLTLVLFPKLVHSAVRAEKTSVLAQALLATFLMGGGAALVCTFFPKLPLWIQYDPSYYPIAHLVPRFGWCILPLTLSTVLVNNLLARQRFGVVPWLVAVAAAYGFTLHHRHASFEQVIHTLGLFGLILLCGCVAFTLREARLAARRSAPQT